MGQLIFQATLGGQVALVGPNTASTFSLNVPAVNGNLVTTGDTGTVTNTMLVNSSATIGSTAVSLGSTVTSFTGLTGLSSSSITDTGLTSGRVTYAGASGLLSDSSSFVFDGNNLGLGVAAGGTTRLSVTASSGSLATFQQTGATGYGVTIVPGADTTYDAFTINNAANTLNKIRMFGNGNATFAGNVGIGTSSPSALAANYTTVDIRGSAGGALRFGNTTDSAYMYSDSNETNIATATNQRMIFSINTAEKMRLDTSGNLGLGVTPSAWSGITAFEQTAGAFSSFSTSQLFVSQNAYYDSGWKYKNTSTASDYYQSAGTHVWRNAPSGSANANITFIQAMTLDVSGNLMVGATSTSAIANKNIDVNGTGDVAVVLRVGGTTTSYLYSTAGQAILGTVGALPITFNPNGTERMRIDSSGNLLVGETAVDSSGGFAVVPSSSASGSPAILAFNKGNTPSETALRFKTVGIQVGDIAFGAAGTAYNTTSDYRLKENISPMTGALAKVIQLKPVTYNWKSNGENGQGFIAHELAEVVPDCVSGEKDAVDSNGKPKYQGIDTSFLVATLTAAIQELKAEFDTYKATHP